jgi:hypothetical protein
VVFIMVCCISIVSGSINSPSPCGSVSIVSFSINSPSPCNAEKQDGSPHRAGQACLAKRLGKRRTEARNGGAKWKKEIEFGNWKYKMENGG